MYFHLLFLSFHCSISFFGNVAWADFYLKQFHRTHFNISRKRRTNTRTFTERKRKTWNLLWNEHTQTQQQKIIVHSFQLFFFNFFLFHSFVRCDKKKSVRTHVLNTYGQWSMSWISVEIPIIPSISKMILNDNDNGYIIKQCFFHLFFSLQSLNLNSLIICVLDLFSLQPTPPPPPSRIWNQSIWLRCKSIRIQPFGSEVQTEVKQTKHGADLRQNRLLNSEKRGRKKHSNKYWFCYSCWLNVFTVCIEHLYS